MSVHGIHTGYLLEDHTGAVKFINRLGFAVKSEYRTGNSRIIACITFKRSISGIFRLYKDKSLNIAVA